jgi:YihY family inner membrane protein
VSDDRVHTGVCPPDLPGNQHEMVDLQRPIRRIDVFQQHHATLSFPYAVAKKFGDDQAGNLAALIAYYGFFSLFPLLLAFVTILGMALRGNPDLQQRIEGTALANLPVVGAQVSQNVHTISGSGLALVLALALAIWAGLGVLRAMESGMNAIWNVPYHHRPGLVPSVVRALLMLVVLTVIMVASAAAGIVGAGTHTWWGLLFGIVVSLTLNFALFAIAFRVLTSEPLSWSDVWPGAAVAGLAWTVLQAIGGYIVSHQLQGASQTYGTFATVIGLMAWLYLAAQMTFFAAEVNVVRRRHLWPRSVVQPPLTEADRRALAYYAKQEERRSDERVDVRVEDAASAR